VASVAATAVLLTLGWLVTSFRVGMSDRVWPTEPWYLVVNGQEWREDNAGFLLEHTHRLAGFVVGGLTSLLAVAAWFTERKAWLKWAGLAAVVGLIAVYGQFHREMGQAWEARKAGRAVTVWPTTTAPTAVAAVAVLGLAGATLAAGGRGRWVRALASASLVAVMVQGLLGGYRVYLDQLVGTELALIHGTFGQAVLCLLLATTALARPVRPERELLDGDRHRVGRLAVALPVLVFVQLVWGVMVRHYGTPLAQRLHVLTAFLVAGLAVWLAAKCVATPTGRRQLGFLAYHLIGIVAVQVLLGVEAWMGKFAAAGEQFAVLPMDRKVTVMSAGVRTLHALVGAALLASALMLALRVWRRTTAETAAAEPGGETRAERFGSPLPLGERGARAGVS
jgi:heme A synthase